MRSEVDAWPQDFWLFDDTTVVRMDYTQPFEQYYAQLQE